MFIFRSARRGRCRARQLRVHGSGAAHDTTRWGCEPHTLGPILQRQGFYTTGCWARTRHSRISMLESSFRCGGSPPALHLEERRVVSNLGVGELRSELPRGGGGGSSRGAGLSTNSTAPQLHSSTAALSTTALSVTERNEGASSGVERSIRTRAPSPSLSARVLTDRSWRTSRTRPSRYAS